ncbi:SPT2 chromatin protein-domain-containing protein [Jimgerdemannia flammicorona]|uniref:SPT2 chromatin protein-domain-containing protein n=1 Tax=Jimgerdemannia flammicorona TaxID=994334 RepID=A0A433QTF4_9FUNG|nr:SPT2 chromatin protein-domain-containing protein [Jimgerdemannia flammicorona]
MQGDVTHHNTHPTRLTTHRHPRCFLPIHPPHTMEFEEILRMASSNTKEAEKDIERRKRRQHEEEQRKQRDEERRRREQKEADERRRRRAMEEKRRKDEADKREKEREQRDRDRPGVGKSNTSSGGFGRTAGLSAKPDKKAVGHANRTMVYLTLTMFLVPFLIGTTRAQKSADLSFDALLKQADAIDAKALRVGPSTGVSRSSPTLKGNERDRDRDREMDDRGARGNSRDINNNTDISRKSVGDRDRGRLHGNGSLGGTRLSASAISSRLSGSSSSAANPRSHTNGGGNGRVASPARLTNGTIYGSKRTANVSRSTGNGGTSSSAGGASARDRLKASVLAPPQRLNTNKRDLRSVEEIQEDMTKRKSGPSSHRNDHGMVSRDNRTTSAGRIGFVSGTADRNRDRERERDRDRDRISYRDREDDSDQKRPVQTARGSSTSTRAKNGVRRDHSPVPASNGVRRRPMSRSPPSGRRHSPPPPPRRRPPPPPSTRRPDRGRRGRYYDEDDDDDMDSFIDDDDDDDEEVLDARSIIGRMFNYDRKRYRDEEYSDEDMEAGASDVLREEQRSAKLARLEDLREEQREREEMEQARQRKLQRGKGGGGGANAKEKKKSAGPGMIDL